jgi:ABC-type polysaccharide/polyol phosphate transport system ATPase subunit
MDELERNPESTDDAEPVPDTIETVEFIGFVDQLGAGKLAIASLLARVCEPDTSEIRVKIDADAKSQPEALQVEVRLRTGHNVTQQAILTRLISDAYESHHESVDSFWDTSVALSKK